MARTLRMAGLAILVLLPLAAAQSTGADPSACVARQEMADPTGDVQAAFSPPPPGFEPLDLTHVAIERTDAGLRMEVGLAADPRPQSGQWLYSYWVSFEDGGKSAAGNTATWTFQRSSSYDHITTMYWDSPESLPVEWLGTTFSFVVPWAEFENAYGPEWPIDFGSPRASSSGPNPASLAEAGLASNQGWQDWVVYDLELVPLPDCSPPGPATTSSEAAAGVASAPGPSSAAAGGSTSGPRGGSSGAPAAPAPGGGDAANAPAGGPGGAQDAPAPALGLVLAGVAGLALLARRRTA